MLFLTMLYLLISLLLLIYQIHQLQIIDLLQEKLLIQYNKIIFMFLKMEFEIFY